MPNYNDHKIMKIGVVVSILVSFLVISCNSGEDQDRTIHVYKPKNDYSSYVPVQLSQDKKTITSIPGRLDPDGPQKLIEGFFLGNTMGVNTGYLSLTIEEYNSYDPLLGIDSLYKYLMDVDPFLEYYISENIALRNEYGIDTVFINELIREDRLTDYYTRLK